MGPGTSREASDRSTQRNRAIASTLISTLATTTPMVLPSGATIAVIPVTTADIIAEVTALVPTPSMSVLHLVNAGLPEVIAEHDLKRFQPGRHLVNAKITGTLPQVLEGPIPHRTWLVSLQMELTKAQKSGRKVTAIKHPTKANLVLPLWALPVWDSIVVASQERMLWVEANDWLRPGEHRPDDWELVEEAHGLMERIPWGMKAWALYGNNAESHMGFLAIFLSISWLAEQNLNIMGVCCNAAAAENGDLVIAYMAPVHLGAQLQWAAEWDDEKVKTNCDLCEFRDTILEKGCRYIHIPANLANAHWVVFLMDVEEKSYCWGVLLLSICLDALLIPRLGPGDSMSVDLYADHIAAVARGLERWTEAAFGTRFANVGRGKDYKIGRQPDTHSCGICVINAIKAAIHGDNLFTAETSSKHRLEHFNEAANYLLRKVCLLSAMHGCTH